MRGSPERLLLELVLSWGRVAGFANPFQSSYSMIEAHSPSLAGQTDDLLRHKSVLFHLVRTLGAGTWLTALPDSVDTHVPSPLFGVGLKRSLRMSPLECWCVVSSLR